MTVRRMEILLAAYLGMRSAASMVDDSDLKMAYTTAAYSAVLWVAPMAADLAEMKGALTVAL